MRSRSLANTAQANKRARQAEQRCQRNVGQRSLVRGAIKKVVISLEGTDKAEAQTLLTAATPIIASMARKGIIHKTTAARHKRRLNQRLRTLSARVAVSALRGSDK